MREIFKLLWFLSCQVLSRMLYAGCAGVYDEECGGAVSDSAEQ